MPKDRSEPVARLRRNIDTGSALVRRRRSAIPGASRPRTSFAARRHRRRESVEIQFYDVKSRQKVSVPESQISKTTYERTTKDGATQTRYALRAVHNGTKLTKFCSQSDWEALDVPRE
jgi:L-lysine 2,3-aminomutase